MVPGAEATAMKRGTMARDPRFDILFEPVRIGPVTAPNRFYQVPHCTGMGFRLPNTAAAMRGTKAEGGWGVVCTEYCSIHPSSDDTPLPYVSLWNESDVRAQALMTEAVHRHGSLAGVELWHGGSASGNLFSREAAMGLRSAPTAWAYTPEQSSVMDKADIRTLRRWHVDAAKRAKRAGFDIVYVYVCHGYLLSEFLSPANQRPDEYGGSLVNRARIVREILEDTREAVGDTCAIAMRISADQGEKEDGTPDTDEPRELIEVFSSLVDLFDIVVADYDREMGSSRFVKEAALEETMSYVKQVTDKPVVTVGRFTSPETMLRQVKQGITDFIGAARPSIADPFLPKKIEEGRLEDIRECVGCNMCFASDARGVPIRCTQNPTIGEEWRRGWHPERVPEKASEKKLLVVGGGPAGLEAALVLGKRGYAVTLAEASRELGGRALREPTLPGLSEWGRVRDWRIAQLGQLPNVEIYLESRLDAEQILEFGCDSVALATGAAWRRDGIGRWHVDAIEGCESNNVLTPDDVMNGVVPEGPVVVFDDDHYYMGCVLAEKLLQDGLDVTLVTPAGNVGAWSEHTAERTLAHTRLVELGVRLETHSTLDAIEKDSATLSCVYTGKSRECGASSIVLVTSRAPVDGLYHELADRLDIRRIGDCLAPGTIATAVHSGHAYARAMDAREDDALPFRCETVDLA